MGIKEKTRIHHQHFCLREEHPGLHGKYMKNLIYTKIFFENTFSAARMTPYFNRYPGNERKAILHYEQNIRLAESLEPSLSVFEVTLRNALIRELERMTGKKDWYSDFDILPVLKPLYKYIAQAEGQIKRRGEAVNPDKVNGELTLGFWVSLFNAEYELALWKDLRRAFPNLPKSQRQRKKVSAPLNAIRNLRNRVFHNEAISWNITRLAELHREIVEVMRWMNADLPEWLGKVDRFDKVSFRVRKEWYGWWKVLFRRNRLYIHPRC